MFYRQNYPKSCPRVAPRAVGTDKAAVYRYNLIGYRQAQTPALLLKIVLDKIRLLKFVEYFRPIGMSNA